MDSDERAQLIRGDGTELEKRDRAVGAQEDRCRHQRAPAARTDLVVDDAVTVVCALQVGHLLDAVHAPGRPEVDDHRLAAAKLRDGVRSPACELLHYAVTG